MDLLSNGEVRSFSVPIIQIKYIVPVIFYFYFYFFFWDRLLLCGPGWSAVARSLLTAALISWTQAILQSSLDYRHVPPYQANFCIFCGDSFAVLPRLILNSWAQESHPARPPIVLGLQAWATVPDLYLFIFHHPHPCQPPIFPSLQCLSVHTLMSICTHYLAPTYSETM